MVAAANGAIWHHGGALSQPTTLRMLPGPNHDWAVKFKDKVIAITGANQGIGLALAEVCLANAASVSNLDISEPAVSFDNLVFRAALDGIVAKKNRLDGMIANTGATKHQPALDFTMDQVKRLFELKVYGSWNCATAAARTFIKFGCKGSIVFTASMISYHPNRAAPSAPCGATKDVLRNMTHTLAMEWAQ